MFIPGVFDVCPYAVRVELLFSVRRDPKLMKSILEAGTNGVAGDISMIFCHADVRGAFMNDNMRCREGLDIGAFPQNMPIFSGHFHKPHTVSYCVYNINH